MIKSKFIVFMILMYVSVTALAGFRTVAFDSGVIQAPAEVITGSIRAAGGGVIFRSVSTCDADKSDICKFSAVSIGSIGGHGYISVNQGKECPAILFTKEWMLKTAIDLVKSETSVVYRNVNLLGDSTESEVTSLYEHNFKAEDVFFNEISPALANTKVGETLLSLDLLLTDVGYYASKSADTDQVKELEDLMGMLGVFNLVSNWTWTDGNSSASFAVNCASNDIYLRGAIDLALLSKDENGEVEVIGVTDKFYGLVNNVNHKLLVDSEEFIRVSAFLRFIKANNSVGWEKIVTESQYLKVLAGETPRIVLKQ